MGQFALGLRSLLIKSAIFVVMAALLAWALGGTLWPKPVHVDHAAGKLGDYFVRVRMTVQRKESNRNDHLVTWQLLFRNDRGVVGIDRAEPVTWADIAGPVLHDGQLYVGKVGIDPVGSNPSRWSISQINTNLDLVATHPMPDRLAVEQQLERVKMGLPIQDSDTIMQQRDRVLNPQ